MQIPVDSITSVEPNNWNGLTKTMFTTSAADKPVYMLHKPENAPSVGKPLDGTISPDRGGNLKFTRTPQQQGGSFAPSSSGGSAPREFKADPEKQASIERQSYFKTIAELANVYYSNQPIPERIKDLHSFVEECVHETRFVLKELHPERTTVTGDVIPTLTEVSDMMPGARELPSDTQTSGPVIGVAASAVDTPPESML